MFAPLPSRRVCRNAAALPTRCRPRTSWQCCAGCKARDRLRRSDPGGDRGRRRAAAGRPSRHGVGHRVQQLVAGCRGAPRVVAVDTVPAPGRARAATDGGLRDSAGRGARAMSGQAGPAGPRTQAQRRARTRSALLAATIDSLVQDGYAGTTTRSVAARAGVTPGALQHHFDSRGRLVTEALRTLSEQLAERFLVAALADGSTRAERAEILIDHLWEVHRGELFRAYRWRPRCCRERRASSRISWPGRGSPRRSPSDWPRCAGLPLTGSSQGATRRRCGPRPVSISWRCSSARPGPRTLRGDWSEAIRPARCRGCP